MLQQRFLHLQDFTSALAVRHATFYITPGLQLTKGQLNFSNAPTIYALGAGLTLGDEITSSDDVQLIFLDSSTLTLAEGQINYKNLDPNQSDIQLWNSNTINFPPNTTLQAYENMYMQTGFINFGSFVGPATYAHKLSPGCPETSDILPVTAFGGPYNPVDLCI